MVDKIIRHRVRVGGKSVDISATVEVFLVQWDNFKVPFDDSVVTYQSRPDACRAARDFVNRSLLS